MGRARGFSLTAIHTLIAAIAVDHRAVLFTVDQDFSRLARIIRTTKVRPQRSQEAQSCDDALIQLA
jgi:hypothetical protein